MNADKYGLEASRKQAVAFICEKFEAVPNEDIQHIEEENFRELLAMDQITATETVIFDRLAQWLKHKKVEEADVVSDMLKLINLEHIPSAVSSC